MVVLLALFRYGQSDKETSVSSTPVQATDEASKSGLTFHGYDCIVDCSGHEAGYEWAEEHDITDPSDCSGNSQSFIEGCQAYAEEQGGVDDNDDERDDSSDECAFRTVCHESVLSAVGCGVRGCALGHAMGARPGSLTTKKRLQRLNMNSF